MNPWPARTCRACREDLAAPGWYQCEFCRYVDPSIDAKARVDPELAALADVFHRANISLRTTRAWRRRQRGVA